MNKVKMISAICLCTGIAFAYLYSKQTEEYSDMVLSNVEALANNNELDDNFEECYLEGSVKCFKGGYTLIFLDKIEIEWELF